MKDNISALHTNILDGTYVTKLKADDISMDVDFNVGIVCALYALPVPIYQLIPRYSN